jgi:hypothetical protein
LSERLGGRPKLAACIITVIATAIVIGPVTWLGFGLLTQPGPGRDFRRHLPSLGKVLALMACTIMKIIARFEDGRTF